MPYETRWESEPNIVYFQMSGHMTEAEITAAVDNMIGLAQQYPDILVHTLIDVSTLKNFPPLPAMGRELRRMILSSPNRNVSTLYGVNPVIRFSLEVLLKVTPMRIRVFPTKDEALVFIHQMIESEGQMEDTTSLRADRRKDFMPSDAD